MREKTKRMSKRTLSYLRHSSLVLQKTRFHSPPMKVRNVGNDECQKEYSTSTSANLRLVKEVVKAKRNVSYNKALVIVMSTNYYDTILFIYQTQAHLLISYYLY